ncbi:DNA cytosine methyltransferase [Candidatus Sumerlaeota bacterium]|nr:DNA cytosine methyltransferase [Candidatus Sumerlaeota bacterium]
MADTIEVLDLFSAAAGGWSLGMHRAGYRTLAACEVEAWRRAVYSENNPGVKVYDDVRTLTATRLLDDHGRLPTIVVGSPPCQDISSANTKGRGVEGERSGLYFEAIRIIGEVRPRWFALENSANLRTRGADAVIAALEAIDYACWPLVVRAGDIGANHERPRAWLIGCDLAQVADPDGERWDEGWRGRRLGLDVPAAADTQHAQSVGHEGGRPWRHGSDGLGSTPVAGSDASDTAQNGCGQGLPWRRAEPAERVSVETCGDAPDANRDTVRLAVVPRGPEPKAAVAGDANQGRDTPHPDQARQAHGCMEPSLRQAEIADDGRGAGRSADGARAGQVGVCPGDCGAADRSGPEWSLEHLADHLRLDDGLSAWLAGTRVQVGNGKGQSAASLVVEAFGDAVVPQIPEAIGRAIIRVERALAVVHERLAA